MGTTNDATIYHGRIMLTMKAPEIKEYLEKIPSSKSKGYGKPFNEIQQLISVKRTKSIEEIAATDEKLVKLSTEWYQELAVLKKVLEDRNEEAVVFGKFGQEDAASFIRRTWHFHRTAESSSASTAATIASRFLSRMARSPASSVPSARARVSISARQG
jgi:vacuolar-type H+-ATPase subunit I/STV1